MLIPTSITIEWGLKYSSVNVKGEPIADITMSAREVIECKFCNIAGLIAKEAMPNDIIIMMGAGSISAWANNLHQQFTQEHHCEKPL